MAEELDMAEEEFDLEESIEVSIEEEVHSDDETAELSEEELDAVADAAIDALQSILSHFESASKIYYSKFFSIVTY